MQGFFALGMLYDALLAYILVDADWRWLQLAGGIPVVLMLSYYWCAVLSTMPYTHCRIMPESPRWLISQNRVEEAKAELKRAARFNKVNIDDSVWKQGLVSTLCLSLPTPH